MPKNSCELSQYTFDDLDDTKLTSLFASGKPFLIKDGVADSSSLQSHKEFLEKFGGLEVIPRVGLEVMVDGRIAKDDASRPRPSVTIAEYLQHLTKESEGIERVLYGQVLSKAEIEAREETLRTQNKIDPDTPQRTVSVDVSDIESFLAKDLSRLGDMDTPLLYLAHENSGSPFQQHGKSVHVALTGKTTWYMYPPSVGVPGDISARFILSEVDGEYLGELSKDRDIRPLICEQSPGDVIFVPEYWPYARRSSMGSVIYSKQEHHSPIRPQNTERVAELKKLSEKYPHAHQFDVDIALSLIKDNPEETVSRMGKAIETAKYNLALRWQVCRLLGRIGAKGQALNFASESIKLLTEASGLESLDGSESDSEELPENFYGEMSASIAKIHWSKFGQLLLYDLNMPLEAIVCFQMRLQITPGDIDVILLKARALTMMGAMDETKVAIQEALDIDPDHQKAKDMLKEIDSEEARNLAEAMRSMGG